MKVIAIDGKHNDFGDVSTKMVNHGEDMKSCIRLLMQMILYCFFGLLKNLAAELMREKESDQSRKLVAVHDFFSR